MPKLLAKYPPCKASAPLPTSAAVDPAEEARADELAARLWILLAGQGPVGLTERERARAGGLSFSGAPQLAGAVAAALEARPDLFRDAGPRAAALRRGLRRALLFRSLQHQLARMSRLCADSYLAELGGATELGLQVIDEARRAARDPALPWPERAGGASAARQLALSDALRVLGLRERRKRRARAARRRRGPALP